MTTFNPNNYTGLIIDVVDPLIPQFTGEVIKHNSELGLLFVKAPDSTPMAYVVVKNDSKGNKVNCIEVCVTNAVITL